ncbi:MAG: hypothetical protein KTR21_06550 [Rhodobacteraceae bacterium]|nr:hypothetical protein [Paracoccaceae bacterium]
MIKSLRAAAGVAALIALAALPGCREAEQDRPMSYQKGVYGGQADQEIDDETRQKLRDRAKYQSFN